MFEEIKGDFWEIADRHRPDTLVCNINTTLKNDDKLVMGAGIAKDFAMRYPFLPIEWGFRITTWPKDKTFIIVSCREAGFELVGLPTKIHWKNPSTLKLIDRSVKQLYNVTIAMGWRSVLMTRPGCGYGGLSWENHVKPILSNVLDERFIVCHM